MKKVTLIAVATAGLLVSITGAVTTVNAAICKDIRCGKTPITPIFTTAPTPSATPVTPPVTPTPTSTPTPTPVTPPVTPTPTATPNPTVTPTPTSTPNAKPDLIITNSYPQSPVQAQHWFNLMVSVKNQGSVQSRTTNIYAEITAASGFFWPITSCSSYSVPVLNPGQSAIASMSCIVYNPGLAKAIVTVDYNNVVPESNEANNTFTKYFNVTP